MSLPNAFVTAFRWRVGFTIGGKTSMTALVRIHTSEGIILAADGRQINSATKEVMSDQQQKIFQIGTAKAAYSLCGHVLLGGRRNTLDTIHCDFVTQTAEQIGDTPVVTGSLIDYARRISLPILESLKNVCAQQDVDLPTRGDGIGPGVTIVTISLDGYVATNTPEGVDVRFYHEAGVLCEPEVGRSDHRMAFSGSQIVLNEMITGKRLDKYKVPLSDALIQVGANELSQGIRSALNYVTACCSPEARALDPDWCGGIGGHIHIAKITPKVGFRWLRGFSPITA